VDILQGGEEAMVEVGEEGDLQTIVGRAETPQPDIRLGNLGVRRERQGRD
jgi:hypothetical protein